MPTKEEWSRVHADLMAKLNLPCMLHFSNDVKVARHTWDDDEITDRGDRRKECFITINPQVDFRVPEHLILHEAAHHRNMEPFLDDVPEDRWCCTGWAGGHCEHWARTLVAMYAELGIALPYSTMFEHFAKLAGIKHKVFEPITVKK
jgi:hypothetical protein